MKAKHNRNTAYSIKIKKPGWKSPAFLFAV